MSEHVVDHGPPPEGEGITGVLTSTDAKSWAWLDVAGDGAVLLRCAGDGPQGAARFDHVEIRALADALVVAASFAQRDAEAAR